MKPPALIIGAGKVSELHAAGYRIVPEKATRAMKLAAGNAMRKRREEADLPWVSNMEKAAIRWEAMLVVWQLDYEGLVKGRRLDVIPEKPPRWRWRLGRFFELAIDWAIERRT